MPNLLVSATTRYDPKGLNKAKKHIVGFDKTVRDLGKSFAAVFSTQKVLAFGKASVQAFIADDKAARVLSRTLSNLGLAFADPSVKTFIGDLEKQYGVLDDFLRPAYQKLLTTTGDLTKSQDLLKTALDLSAQSGESVVSVAGDLGRAYAGNTKGLQKYGLGLTKAQLAAMSFEEILAKITEISKGQAAAAANTYAGKLDKLNVAAANASETIGGALVDAFVSIAGDGDIDKATSKIDLFAQSLATIISPVRMKELFAGVDLKFGLIPVLKTPNTNRSASPAGTYKRNAAEIAAAAAAKKQRDEMLAATKKATKAQQDLLKISKAKAIFDIQKIQIEAALKGKISNEERIRLLLMKAIENENIDDIAKYTKALDEAQAKTKVLQDLLDAIGKNRVGNVISADFYKGMTDAQIALEKFKESGGFRIAGIGNPITPDFYRGLSDAMIALEKFKEAGGFRLAGTGPQSAVPSNGAGGFTDSQNAARLAAEAEAAAKAIADALAAALKKIADANNGSPTVVVNTGPSMADENTIVDAVQAALNEIARRGNLTTYAGALPA